MMVGFDFFKTRVPFFSVEIPEDINPLVLNERIVNFEYSYEDDKTDMVTITFLNYDYAVSDSPLIVRDGILVVQWGWLNYQISEPEVVMIKDFEGLELFKVIAYKVDKINLKKLKNKNYKFSQNTPNFLEYTPGYTPTTSSRPGVIRNWIPDEIWQLDADVELYYNTYGIGLIKNFDPYVRTYNNEGTGSTGSGYSGIEDGVTDIDLDEKMFLTDALRGYIPDSYVDKLNAGEEWVIDAVTGIEEKISAKAKDLAQKIWGSDALSDAGAGLNSLLDSLGSLESNLGTGGSGGVTEVTTEATASTFGLVYLKNKMNVLIKGVGAAWSGKWYIKGVTHKIGSNGYECDLQLYRPTSGTGKADGSGYTYDESSSDVDSDYNGDSRSSFQLNNQEADTWIIDAVTGEEIKE